VATHGAAACTTLAILITAVGFNWTGYGFGWTLRGTAQQMVIDAAVAAPKSVRVNPLQMMMNARDLPTQRYVSRLFRGVRLNGPGRNCV
jgi:hypothetical protein